MKCGKKCRIYFVPIQCVSCVMKILTEKSVKDESLSNGAMPPFNRATLEHGARKPEEAM